MEFPYLSFLFVPWKADQGKLLLFFLFFGDVELDLLIWFQLISCTFSRPTIISIPLHCFLASFV